jgi:hypothetical protein
VVGFQDAKVSRFYRAFAFEVGNKGALLRLFRFMVANIHQAFNHELKGIYLIVVQHKALSFSSFLAVCLPGFEFLPDHTSFIIEAMILFFYSTSDTFEKKSAIGKPALFRIDTSAVRAPPAALARPCDTTEDVVEYPLPGADEFPDAGACHPQQRPAVALPCRGQCLHDGIHSGQISLPGGKAEKTDPGPAFTALREAREEIGIDPEKVTIIGRLTDLYIPPSNYVVSPFIGYLAARPVFTIEPAK